MVLPRWLLRLRARSALALGRTERAVVLFEKLIARFADDAHAWASLAHAHAERGRQGSALACAAQCVRLRPLDAAAWFNHGFLLERAQQLDAAREAFERATVLAPHGDRAWYGLGLVLIQLGRLDDAVVALERNTALQPMSPFGWYQLARVHVERGAPTAARRVIDHLARFEPKVARQLERETGLAG